MITSCLPVLLLLGHALSGTGPLPKVADIPFEDLVRFSDVIAVGTVERVETIVWNGWKPEQDGLDRLPPKVPFAEVVLSRVLKGDPATERVTFLAAGTWICDITSAEVGERALFFLAGAERNELFDDELRRSIRARFCETPLMRVMWAGRGKMPLRTLPDGEYATYWEGDVILPEDFPDVEGPEPQYQFIRSAPLAAFVREIAACVTAHKETWLTASVSDVMDGSSTWDLEVTWDRQARLVVHDPSGERVERFLLDSARAVCLSHAIKRTRDEGPPAILGAGRPRRGVRALSVLNAKEPLSIRILALDQSWMHGKAREGTRLALEAWAELRECFDEPACSDHRPEDERWLPRRK